MTRTKMQHVMMEIHTNEDETDHQGKWVENRWNHHRVLPRRPHGGHIEHREEYPPAREKRYVSPKKQAISLKL